MEAVMRKLILLTGITFFLSAPINADHTWSTYHWARTTPSFDLILVNSTTTDWDSYVTAAVGDWSLSQVVSLAENSGDTSMKTRRQCRPPDGQVRICNLDYGQTGWLGIAGIYLDGQGHIVKGYTKLNDTYFSFDYYNTDAWKRSVSCQELGHDLGLDHQDEDFNNTPKYTCMDYQDPPFAYPNTHDYDELVSMYAHSDSYDSYDTGGAPSGGIDEGTCNAPPGKGCNKNQNGGSDTPGQSDWGMSMGRRGQTERFERAHPDGTRVVTFVTWAAGY
jgi:hypothetical protein